LTSKTGVSYPDIVAVVVFVVAAVVATTLAVVVVAGVAVVLVLPAAVVVVVAGVAVVLVLPAAVVAIATTVPDEAAGGDVAFVGGDVRVAVAVVPSSTSLRQNCHPTVDAMMEGPAAPTSVCIWQSLSLRGSYENPKQSSLFFAAEHRLAQSCAVARTVRLL